MSEFTPVSLETLGHGAAQELFVDELQKVLDNILDPNVKLEAVRKVTLDLTIRPKNQDGSVVIDYELIAKSKLVPNTGFGSRMYVSKQGGKAKAYEQKPQEPLFPESEEDKIRSIK